MPKNFKRWCVVAFLSAIAIGFVSTAIQTTQSKTPELDQSKETKELREKFDRDYNQLMESAPEFKKKEKEALKAIERIKELDKQKEELDREFQKELEKEREGEDVSPDERLNNQSI
jgi:Skp family chaperone for outer membrane proteins